jgi:hypothetical protein
MHTYVTKFDDMPARMLWYNDIRSKDLDLIAADIVKGIRRQEIIGGERESFLPFKELLAWIPTIFSLQQQRVHDIVGLTHNASGDLLATCSCGLTVVVPEHIAQIYRIPAVFLCTYQHREHRFDADLESWFYLLDGHRDLLYGEPTAAFIALYSSSRPVGPRRQLVCHRCELELEFHFSRDFALYRPVTYSTAIMEHLAICSGVPAN